MDEAQRPPFADRMRKSFNWKVVCKRTCTAAIGQLIALLSLFVSCVVTGNDSLPRQFFEFLNQHCFAVLQTMLVFSLVMYPVFGAFGDAMKAFFGELVASQESQQALHENIS